ncbi:MAG: CapA family protein [Ruminococcaceae bacterium]|nr:CapA family protein [Oscillospiraceae bacterium]
MYTKCKVGLLALFTLLFLLTGCSAPEEEVAPAFAEQPAEPETISILALGDNLLHMPVVNSGKQADGTYDYAHLFAGLQPAIREADLAVIGQETIFGGREQGYSGYPLFNSPTDMGKSLAMAGFDVVLHASNHVLDMGAAGVEHTLHFWKSYPGMRVLGINENEEEKQTVEIEEVKGATLALLNYTYGTNGISVPANKEYLVNYIDREKIEQDALFAEANADFTIAFMHWGTEYSIMPDAEQKSLAQAMCDWGVDLIIGSHPHVIEPVEWRSSENGNKMLVYYSLGNFVSRQKEARNLLGGMAEVSLSYDGESVSIADYAFVPIVTHYNMDSAGFAVYPLSDYSDDLAAVHGVSQYDGAVSIARFKSMVEETFAGYDMSQVELATP